MRRPHRHNFLFRIACEGLKLLAILVMCFICACLFLAPFGALVQVEAVIDVVVPFFLRLAICLLGMLVLAGLFESLE
ncbi:hypothetical protein PN498_20865 [Oscillatoria sp. CS-180]|uniref:hypothetical protein n=1 Tax=Oscillatoria sp. CS-180 TaxID=3021720 RepID=UPI00232F471E|nr:hypothetical protein [Oscillatoria sp. CS-180]MDB9528456.1 hypothetical protein [Oscillatoria sp. CS-180]